MPSLTHEALLMLFRNRPELAPELLRDALHLALPKYAEARIESAELTQVAPAEYHADLVVLLVDGKPVLGIIVEVQLQKDDRKPFTWPVYAANLRARLECPTCVLVVTPSEPVAAWARMPVDMGPRSRFEALVVGPDAVPIVSDVDIARRDPELAVLSAMAHGRGEAGSAIAHAALSAVADLDEERVLLYSDLVLFSLSAATRVALEALMSAGNYEYQSDFVKKHRADAEAGAKANDVLTVLDARGIPVTAEQQVRVRASTDLAVLERWIRKAAVVTTADELFAD